MILHCVERRRPEFVVDLERGTVAGRATVRRFLRIEDGMVTEERSYRDDARLYLQLLSGGPGEVSDLLVTVEEIFHTNFNQMYLLGRYDAQLYQELYNRFPVARCYRLLPPR